MIYCMVGGTGFFIDILGRCYLSVLCEAPSLGTLCYVVPRLLQHLLHRLKFCRTEDTTASCLNVFLLLYMGFNFPTFNGDIVSIFGFLK